MGDHPTDHQMREYVVGRLVDAEADLIAEHVAQCEHCCSELDVLSIQPDRFIDKLRAARHFVERHRFGDQAENKIAAREARLSSVDGDSDSTVGGDARTGHAAPIPRRIGDFELLEEIGRGGMGVVYKARQLSLDRIVAIKAIREGPFASARDVERFQAESSAAAKLQHPGIVSIHEVGESGNQHFFSMDYVEGHSLAWITRQNPLPAKKAAGYVEAIARAMDYAHGQGVIHRDLKPANVLIDTADQPRITDFGLAKRIDEGSNLTSTGHLLGTPSYMSPEQARGGEIGPAGDVYSLGAMLYELVTGRPPFRAESAVETVLQILESEPVPARLLNPKVPADIETICLKCLEKDPQRRYASAEELADELRRFAAGQPIVARPVSRTGRLWRWCKRNPGVASLTTAVGVLLVLMTVISIGAAVRIAAAADEVELQRDLAVEAIDEMLLEIGLQTLTVESHSTNVRRHLVERALLLYERFAERAGADAKAAGRIARANFSIGYLQLYMEEHASAERALKTSAIQYKQLLDEFPENPDYHSGRVKTWHTLGILYAKLGRKREAESAFVDVIQFCAVHPDSATSLELNWRLSQAKTELAGLLFEQARYVEAESLLDQSIVSFPQFAQLDETNKEHYSQLARVLSVRGDLYSNTGRTTKAEDDFRRALDLCKQLAPRFRLPFDQRQMVAIYLSWATLLTRLNPDQAISHFQQAVEEAKTLVIRFPGVALYQRDLASAYSGLGLLHYEGMRYDQAQSAYEHSRRVLHGLPALTPRDKGSLANLHNNWGNLHMRQGNETEGLSSYQQCISLAFEVIEQSPGNAYFLSMIGGALHNIARIHFNQADFAGMRQSALAAVGYQLKALHIDPKHRQYRMYLRNHFSLLAGTLNDDKQAWDHYARATAIAAELCDDFPEYSYYAAFHGENYYLLGRLAMDSPDAQIRSLPVAIGLLERATEISPDVKYYWIRLGRAYLQEGTIPEALGAFEQAQKYSPAFGSYDWFYLAMAQWQNGLRADAAESYGKAIELMTPDVRNDPRLAQYRTLVDLRNEARKLLGLE